MPRKIAMRRFARALVFVGLFAAYAHGLAASPEWLGPPPNARPDTTRGIAAMPAAAKNACIVALLRRIVDDDADVRGPQRLYVGLRTTDGSATDDSGAVVRVYWPQARAILLIDPAMACGDDEAPPTDFDLAWYRTKARIDLDTDVVATPEDIAGSTYLVDRAWVDAVVAESLRSEPLIIVPTQSSE